MFLKYKFCFGLVKDIQSKWRYIRDNYVRNLKKQNETSKSGSGRKKVKEYIYGQQLSFLKRNQELRPTAASFEDNTEEVSQDRDISDAEDNGLNVHETLASTESAPMKVSSYGHIILFGFYILCESFRPQRYQLTIRKNGRILKKHWWIL